MIDVTQSTSRGILVLTNNIMLSIKTYYIEYAFTDTNIWFAECVQVVPNVVHYASEDTLWW